jgi:hypothetical protein
VGMSGGGGCLIGERRIWIVRVVHGCYFHQRTKTIFWSVEVEDEYEVIILLMNLWMPSGRRSLVAPLLMSLIRVWIEAGKSMGNCDSLDTGKSTTIRHYIKYLK